MSVSALDLELSPSQVAPGASDGCASSLATATELGKRLVRLWKRTGDEGLRRLATAEGCDTGLDDAGEVARGDAQVRQDWVSTLLMNAYRNTADSQVFAALYDLNKASFMQAIRAKGSNAIVVLGTRTRSQKVQEAAANHAALVR